MVQRCIIEAVLIDHLPHVNSIINSLTNSGDVSFLTSVEQIVQRHSSASKSDMGEETDISRLNLASPNMAIKDTSRLRMRRINFSIIADTINRLDHESCVHKRWVILSSLHKSW